MTRADGATVFTAGRNEVTTADAMHAPSAADGQHASQSRFLHG